LEFIPLTSQKLSTRLLMLFPQLEMNLQLS